MKRKRRRGKGLGNMAQFQIQVISLEHRVEKFLIRRLLYNTIKKKSKIENTNEFKDLRKKTLSIKY